MDTKIIGRRVTIVVLKATDVVKVFTLGIRKTKNYKTSKNNYLGANLISKSTTK